MKSRLSGWCEEWAELWDALKSFILTSLKIKVAPNPIIVLLDTLNFCFLSRTTPAESCKSFHRRHFRSFTMAKLHVQAPHYIWNDQGVIWGHHLERIMWTPNTMFVEHAHQNSETAELWKEDRETWRPFYERMPVLLLVCWKKWTWLLFGTMPRLTDMQELWIT